MGTLRERPQRIALKMKMNKTLLFIVASGAILSLAGCSANDPNKNVSTEAPKISDDTKAKMEAVDKGTGFQAKSPQAQAMANNPQAQAMMKNQIQRNAPK